MRFYSKAILLLIVLVMVQGKVEEDEQCVHHDTCGSCLDAAHHCSWCTDKAYDMRLTRCMTKKDLIKSNCREKYILVNEITRVEYVEDKALRDFSKERLDAVQIRPQKAKFKLRKGQKETIEMVYRPAKNYPFDLYYLMDLTYSMRDDKETLLGVGNSLASFLNSLSENYRIGFGSFGDKNTMPMMIPGFEENPCALEKVECKPLYSYHHSLSLTKDVTEFIQKVNQSQITGNLDTTEGGMDALMQLLVCSEQVGWNNGSRKIVVFASDAKQHFAGDGRLAGITEVNDKKCHLNERGEYTESLVYDYPSLEQIYRELVKNKVNIIFAVTKDQINHYNQLNDVMDDISAVGQLDSDSSNILQLVEAGYKEFARRAHFLDDAPDYIKMTYRTTCAGKYEDFIETSKCDNTEIGKDIKFYIDVQLVDNPNDNVYNHKIRIEESSIGLEALELDVEIPYSCPCLNEETGETNSTICSSHGEFKCGMCQCDNGWSGKTCDCNVQLYSSSKELENECREPYEEDGETKYTQICTDHGECLCGKCFCNVGFFGKYCNCLECPSYNGMQCGGADHGICTCSGKCKCQSGWEGEKCDCATSAKGCSAPNSEKICSGRGSCQCGTCSCNEGFLGVFCESTIKGENGLCTFYEPCVQCIVLQKQGEECTHFNQVCKSKYGDTYGHSFVENLDDNHIKCMALVKRKDTSQQHNFIYDINKDHDTFLTIEEYKNPSILVSYFGYFSLLGVILMTLLFGLVGICCYVYLLRAKDRKEFAAFEKRLADTKYEFDSPIYKSPITEFRVPQKREDGGFEMISNPTPKTPGTGGSDKFTFTSNGTAASSPKSPGVVLRPPFKQSPSVESSNIIYQTSSVLAKDITSSASPTENSSSIIFKKFPVEPFHLDSSATSVPATISIPITPKPTPRNLPLITETESTPSTYVNQKFDDNHHSIQTIRVNHQRPISPISTFTPNSDEHYFRTPPVPMRPLSPSSSQTSTTTRYFVNGQECDLPFDDSSSSASTLTRNVYRTMPGEEIAQTPQRVTIRRYLVNGQEVDQQPVDDSSSSVSTTTRNIYRAMPGQDFGQTAQRTTVKSYFVDEQGVEHPYFDDDNNLSTTTTKTIFRTTSNGEPPMTPLRVQHVKQEPQSVFKNAIHQTPTQQRDIYFNAGDNNDGQLVETETIIRRTVTEPGQVSPVMEKFITIRTSEQRGSPSH